MIMKVFCQLEIWGLEEPVAQFRPYTTFPTLFLWKIVEVGGVFCIVCVKFSKEGRWGVESSTFICSLHKGINSTFSF